MFHHPHPVAPCPSLSWGFIAPSLSGFRQTRSGTSFSPWAAVAPFGIPIEAPADFDLRARTEAALADQVQDPACAEQDGLPVTPLFESEKDPASP
ncbi:hypothetical protein BD309DRAFT_1024695 [Dichomitus squalens]|uniref:Uncharacterized protein n=2 Tax=Dichomitus squalens TaxID=114155 RepID=A0A4Q9N7H0_9APHY|nr:uncharacterized protein DICSQDRAFT_174901 [Dichomitus squalens LYAD-421 SS1]EJF56452.1 hypothetical protein DICSQDRAFT_174901 [Dichomitus squalens LYAD-421 SS1]TBU21140.1 hypothetical protein BD311DRAFT_812627 [Dichomitus squalens]TBU36077.1 hypothetical protein BD309DRAFT_1024695 [Dichomitus squalens]TBU53065.1 hypothetical protein BD310DRAFT_830959 [Dichomitus squalens]